MLIDGKGQLGEGRMWFNGIEQLRLKARPRIIRAVSSPELDHISGDATEAYPRDIGLRRYIRHLIFLKPEVLIIIDDIELDEVGFKVMRISGPTIRTSTVVSWMLSAIFSIPGR